jgi:hypothetical protein
MGIEGDKVAGTFSRTESLALHNGRDGAWTQNGMTNTLPATTTKASAPSTTFGR